MTPSAESQENPLDETMFDLFCHELETHSAILGQGLVELEQRPSDKAVLESLMRAAHSIKGASRVMNLSAIARLAHAMEDCFVSAQKNQLQIGGMEIDQLLRGVDLIERLSKIKLKEINPWLEVTFSEIESIIHHLSSFAKTPSEPFPVSQEIGEEKEGVKQIEAMKTFKTSFSQDRVLRITAENLNRLMGLAGESLVESHWLPPFGENLQKFKSNVKQISMNLNILQDNLKGEKLNEIAQRSLKDLNHQVNDIYSHLTERLRELDHFIQRHENLSDRLYHEVINSRMRPFADGVEGFPRLVRDLARQLGKKVVLEIEGKSTPVDREILEKLESPLSHLLRNAVDHGIEMPEERISAGKPAEGTIKLEARHLGGVLSITVSDDGRGIDIEKIRRKVVENNLMTEGMAQKLTSSEVIDFLFLPGFSTSDQVTEISGRGVGLDIVQRTIQEVGGSVQTIIIPGKGAAFHLQLPLTLSVIHALIVEISGEAYAFPLARIDRSILIHEDKIELVENRQFYHNGSQNIGLIPLWQVLELSEPHSKLRNLPLIILKDQLNSYGLVVDRLIGEKELVVQELDSRLGKVPDILAGALMEDGSPVLIIDCEDIIHSIHNFLSGGRLAKVNEDKPFYSEKGRRKRILIVDDSITVREVESRLLENKGYEVDTAVNGIDGWYAVRSGHYDLVISDVDMPRMNGLELLQAIKNDPKLNHLPVMIVSYKGSEEDRMKGLEAGADYYLTKSSFHDTTLIDAVNNLIGS